MPDSRGQMGSTAGPVIDGHLGGTWRGMDRRGGIGTGASSGAVAHGMPATVDSPQAISGRPGMPVPLPRPAGAATAHFCVGQLQEMNKPRCEVRRDRIKKPALPCELLGPSYKAGSLTGPGLACNCGRGSSSASGFWSPRVGSSGAGWWVAGWWVAGSWPVVRKLPWAERRSTRESASRLRWLPADSSTWRCETYCFACLGRLPWREEGSLGKQLAWAWASQAGRPRPADWRQWEGLRGSPPAWRSASGPRLAVGPLPSARKRPLASKAARSFSPSPSTEVVSPRRLPRWRVPR